MNKQGILEEIANAIYIQFPGVNLDFEQVNQTGEMFVLVDKVEVYSTQKYQALITDIKSRLLWPRGVNGVFFGVADAGQNTATFSFASEDNSRYLSYQVGIDVGFYKINSPNLEPADLSRAA